MLALASRAAVAAAPRFAVSRTCVVGFAIAALAAKGPPALSVRDRLLEAHPSGARGLDGDLEPFVVEVDHDRLEALVDLAD